VIRDFVAGRSEKERAFLAIVVGGVVAGTIDILYAGLCYGWDLILAISAGLVGLKALRIGGAGYYSLGLLLHFFISLTFAAFYYASSRKWTFLIDSWVVCGLAYGAAVQIVMMYLVLPFLTVTHPHGPYELNEVLVGLGAHMVVIGLPISCSMRLFTKPAGCRAWAENKSVSMREDIA
jgi:hypothetical protein